MTIKLQYRGECHEISLADMPYEICDAVNSCPRGSYQRSLLEGAAWSGGDLRGKASNWSSQYARSRGKLLARIRAALQPLGWDATDDLVCGGSPRRWRRKLILWATNQPDHIHVW